MAIYIVVLTGLAGTIMALLLALREGPTDPVHRLPWIIALVALGLDSAIHVAISVGAVVTGGWQSAWVAIGSLAIVGVFATAWRAPRIGGWWLITTAIALPLMLVLATALTPPVTEETVPVSVLLTFYTPRMLIVGGLLIWSAGSAKQARSNAPVISRADV